MSMPDQTNVGTTVLASTTGNPTNQAPLQLVLKNADGSPFKSFTPAAAQADSTASDVAGLKTDLNALLAKLRTAGIVSP